MLKVNGCLCSYSHRVGFLNCTPLPVVVLSLETNSIKISGTNWNIYICVCAIEYDEEAQSALNLCMRVYNCMQVFFQNTFNVETLQKDEDKMQYFEFGDMISFSTVNCFNINLFFRIQKFDIKISHSNIDYVEFSKPNYTTRISVRITKSSSANVFVPSSPICAWISRSLQLFLWFLLSMPWE